MIHYFGKSKMLFLQMKVCLLIVIFIIRSLNGQQTSSTTQTKKSPKLLFSVIQFTNSACKTQGTDQSGVRNGTCYTISECSSKGGVASGSCAAGFGVCCLFLVSATNSVVNQNCTYIRNPGFPSNLTSTSSLNYTVIKSSSDVCYLRLDFDSFTILGPTSTVEGTATNVGDYCPDKFKVTTTAGQVSSAPQGQTIPILCGENTGQHIYVDIGTQAKDTANLLFTFSTGATNPTRNWEIKVSQITCSNPSRPPNGCLQYFINPFGRMTTFNFFSKTESTHLDYQMYSICIRRQAGCCCIQYQACEGVQKAFSIDGNSGYNPITMQFCEEDKDGDLTCNSGMIQVISAFYGRTSLTICPIMPFDTTSCFLDITSLVIKSCGGMPSCTINYGLKFTGKDDPCVGKTKYTEVVYTCVAGPNSAITTFGGIDNQCTNDYISIPASSNSCSATGGKMATKYCGNFLGQASSGFNNPICDCSGNFRVGIRTDGSPDFAIAPSRGVCLDFMQVPCTTN